MKKHLLFFVLLINFLTLSYSAKSQSACPNADFSDQDFNGWNGYIGTYNNCCNTKVTVPGRHTIINFAGTDPRTAGGLSLLPPGMKVCAKLGNEQVGAQAERLTYSMAVTKENALFIYRYAVVMEDPAHGINEQPKFEIKLLDATGQMIDRTCGYYKVVSSGTIPGFNNVGIVRWKDWTIVGIDLTTFIGQTITIEFATYDCQASGHYGYAYISAGCSPLIINVDYCIGDTNVVLSAPDGFAYKWSTGETTKKIVLNKPTVGSVYTCELTSVTGCKVVLSAKITPTIVDANFSINSTCSNNNAFNDLSTASIGGIGRWIWDFGDGTAKDTSQNPTHKYNKLGTFPVTLIAKSSMGGCADTIVKSNTVTNNVAKISVLSPVCANAPTTITYNGNASTNAAFTWDFAGGVVANGPANGQGPYYVKWTDPGVYKVNLQVDENNCTFVASDSVKVNRIPTSTFINNPAVCLKDSTSFTYTGDGTSPPTTTYLWSFDGGKILSGLGSGPYKVAWNSSGTKNVKLTVTEATCSSTTTRPIIVNIIPDPSFSFIDSVCVRDTSTITYTGGASSNALFIWTITDATIIKGSGIGPYKAYWNKSGSHNINLKVTEKGCSNDTTKAITIKPLPIADAGRNRSICRGDTANLHGSGGTYYKWSSADGQFTANSADVVVSPKPINKNFYFLTVTEQGCTATDNAYVHVFDLPNAYAGKDAEVCSGQSTLLKATGGKIYLWDNGDSNDTITVKPIQTTKYIVIVTDSNNCSLPDTVLIIVNPLPKAIINGPKEVCNTEFEMNGSQSTVNKPNVVNNFYWDFGDNTYSVFEKPKHRYTNTGTYTIKLTVNSNKNCKDSVTQQFVVNKPPSIDLGPNKYVSEDVFATADATSGYTYIWTNGAITQTISSNIPGPYSVTITDKSGCVSSDSIRFLPMPVIIPNVMTPNSDGYNDKFHVKNLYQYPKSKIYIYNRWGKKVYENNDYQSEWDGGGHSDGVYYYILWCTDGNEYHGTITIMGYKK